MPEITADLVKQLRESTNVSMMECKKALVEAKGDMQQAARILREKGIATATRKSTRATNQGVVASATADGGRAASLIEVNCESDFVTRNEGFKAFVAELARAACDTDGTLADQVKDKITAKVAEIGENIVLRRNTRLVLNGKGRVASYIHLGGKVGVLLEVGCENDATVSNSGFAEVVKDITLHVAAAAPRFLTADTVTATEIAAEREIYAKQMEGQGKPAQVIAKIVEGKLQKFYSDVCLVDQPFVKDPKVSIKQLLAAKGKELGDTLSVRRFVRYQMGE
jgi:elongation factor Ts